MITLLNGVLNIFQVRLLLFQSVIKVFLATSTVIIMTSKPKSRFLRSSSSSSVFVCLFFRESLLKSVSGFWAITLLDLCTNLPDFRCKSNFVIKGKKTYNLLVRRQAKSRVLLMMKVANKVIIVLQGRKYHFIFGSKISGLSNRSCDPRKVTWGSNF